MSAILRTLLPLAVIVSFAAPVRSDEASAQKPGPDPTLGDVLLGQWTDVGERLIAMAEDFPDAKYDFRPTADVRSFADVLRHVAFWNTFVRQSARGEKA